MYNLIFKKYFPKHVSRKGFSEIKFAFQKMFFEN